MTARVVAVLLLLLLTCSSFSSAASAAVLIKNSIHYPVFDEATAEYIVQFEGDPLVTRAPGLLGLDSGVGIADLPEVQLLLEEIASEQDEIMTDLARAVPDVELGDVMSVSFNGVVAKGSAEDMAKVAERPGVKKVFPNGKVWAAVEARSEFIGVPLLRALTVDGTPVTGEGVTVAVIDTGIDYTHPDLGGGFGPEFKVVGGYDFINDDADPLDDESHGTHVAGIVAADGALTGVAPGAKLLAYKVLNASGTGEMSGIVLGIDRAILDGADVINLSLGGFGYPEDPSCQAVDNAVAAGISVVVSAGNKGPWYYGTWSPASAKGALTVGASYALNDDIGLEVTAPEPAPLGSGVKMSGSPLVSEAGLEGELVFAGLGSASDYLGVDATGNMVLVDRGDFTFSEKASQAFAHGAIGLIIGNNEPGPFMGRLSGDPGLPVVCLSREEAQVLKDLLASGTVRVRMSPTYLSDVVAAWSCRGPGSWLQKPDVVAPGTDILSTVLSGGYEAFGGTSMASPMVAGVVALLRQLHPEWSPDELKSAVSNTGKVLRQADGTPFDALAQGGGRIDVAAILASQATVSPSSLSFVAPDGDRNPGPLVKTVTVQNVSGEAVTYSLSVTGNSEEYQVSTSPQEVTVPAGESATFEVTAVMDVEAMMAGLLLGSGYVLLDDSLPVPSEDGDLRIPFLISPIWTALGVAPEPAVGPGYLYTYAGTYYHGLGLLDEAPITTVTDPQGEPIPTEDLGCEKVFGGTGDAYLVGFNVFTSGLHQGQADFEVKGVTARRSVSFVADLERGGAPEAGWHSVGPPGGVCRTAASPAGDRILAASDRILTLSEDGGYSWQDVAYWLGLGDYGAITGLAASQQDSLLVYMSTCSYTEMLRGAVLASRDGGRTWQRTSFPNVEVHGVAIDPNDDAHVFAWNPYSVYESRNGGETWDKLEQDFLLAVDCKVFGDAVYVVDRNKPGGRVLRRRLDGGAFIPVVTEDQIGAPISSFGLGPTADSLYVGGYARDAYYSKDGGQTWLRSSVPEPEPSTEPGIDQVLEILPLSTDEVYFCGTTGVYRSADGGQSFSGVSPDTTQLPWLAPEPPPPGDIIGPFDAGETPALSGPSGFTGSVVEGTAETYRVVVEDLLYDRVGGYLYAAVFGEGLFRTRDAGATWELIRPTGEIVWALQLVEEALGGKFIYAGTVGELCRAYMADGIPREPYPGEGLLWRKPHLGDAVGSDVLALDQGPPGLLYKVRKTAFSYFYLSRSADYGESWEPIHEQSGDFTCFAVHPANPDILYAGYFAIYESAWAGFLDVSQDGGQSWSTIELGECIPNTLCPDPSDPDRVLLGTTRGLYLSADGGLTWENPNPDFQAIVVSSAFQPSTGRVLLGTAEGVAWTDDWGLTVSYAPSGPVVCVSDIVVHPDNDQLMFAGVLPYWNLVGPVEVDGVYVSTDRGLTWEAYVEGLTNRTVFDLELDGEWLYAATNGGVWVRDVGDLVGPVFQALPGPASSRRLRADVSALEAEPSAAAPFAIDPDPIGTVIIGEPVSFSVTAHNEDGTVRQDYAGPLDILIDGQTPLPDDGSGWVDGSKVFTFTPEVGGISYGAHFLAVADASVSDIVVSTYFDVVHFVDHYTAVPDGEAVAGEVYGVTIEARTADDQLDTRENSAVSLMSGAVGYFEDPDGMIGVEWPKSFVEGRLHLYARAESTNPDLLRTWIYLESGAGPCLGQFESAVEPGPPVSLELACPAFEFENRVEVRAGETVEFAAVGLDRLGNPVNAFSEPVDFYTLPGSGDGALGPDGVFTGTKTGTLRLGASCQGLTGVSPLVIVRPGVAEGLEIANPTLVAEVGVPYHFFARGVDGYGNPVPGTELRWRLIPVTGSGTLDVSYGRFVPSRPGEVVIQVQALSGAEASLSVEVSQGRLHHLTMLPAGSLRLVRGQVVRLGVAAYDVSGNCLGEPDNVAWGLDPGSTGSGTIEQDGCFQGTGVGRVVVRASYNGMTVSKTIYVDPFPDSEPPSPPEPPSSPPSETAQAQRTHHTPDEAVRVATADGGLEIHIPPGTVDVPYWLSVHPASRSDVLAAWDIEFRDADGRRITTFRRPVELWFRLAALGLAAQGFEDATAVRWDEALARWLPVPGRLDGSTLTVPVTQFSLFGLSSQPVGRRFADTTGHWAEEAILTASSLGLVDGYPDGTFRPSQVISRAELAKFVALAAGYQGDGRQPSFVDGGSVPDWALGYVGYVQALGLVSGHDDGTFRPGETATRAQVAAILARLLATKGLLAGSPSGAPSPFADASDIPTWCLSALELVLREGIVRGYEDGTFRPNEPVTRAELVTMLVLTVRRMAEVAG